MEGAPGSEELCRAVGAAPTGYQLSGVLPSLTAAGPSAGVLTPDLASGAADAVGGPPSCLAGR